VAEIGYSGKTADMDEVRMQARKRQRKSKASGVFMTKDSPFYADILKELTKYKKYPDDADAVRKLLDKELGDRTLTEELYKMRDEAL
jgi:hypothetical protein